MSKSLVAIEIVIRHYTHTDWNNPDTHNELLTSLNLVKQLIKIESEENKEENEKLKEENEKLKKNVRTLLDDL